MYIYIYDFVQKWRSIAIFMVVDHLPHGKMTMENDWGFAPFSEPSVVPLMPEVLMELCLLIGTDATTPFIQEQCHDFLAGFYGSPNWRFLMGKSSTNGGFLLTIYIYII